MASLDSVTRKLDRADYHIEDIGSRIAAFSVKPYDIVPYFNDDTKEIEVRLANVRPISPEWPTIIGDAVNNLRAVLDHLMWNLVLLNGAQPTKGTQFPISTKGNSYDGDTSGLTGGASAKHIALIKGLQPYHRAGAETTHPLFWLRELSNFDKHRVLLLSEISLIHGSLGFKGVKGGYSVHVSWIKSPEAKDGAALASIKLANLDAIPDFEVQMQPQVSCEIRFAQGCPDCIVGEPILKVLNTISAYVNNDVISKFSDDF